MEKIGTRGVRQPTDTPREFPREATDCIVRIDVGLEGKGKYRTVGLWVLSCPRPVNAGTPCPAAG